MEQRQLRTWEEFLQPFFTRIKLLDEIPVSQVECEQILDLIKKLIDNKGFKPATDALVHLYPHVFIIFLAKFSAFDEEEAFWMTLGKKLEKNPQMFFQPQTHWGKYFLAAVTKFSLRSFEQQNFGNRYVNPIRIHGGIPIYFLSDFFKDFIVKSVERNELKVLSAAQLIKEYLPDAHVCAPIRNYLNNSKEIGIDFIEKCRTMARQYLAEEDAILDAKNLELPVYVVNQFILVMQRQGKGLRYSNFVRPKIVIDAQGTLRLQLPHEPISAKWADGELFWQGEYLNLDSLKNKISHGMDITLQVGHEHAGWEVFTEETEFPIAKRSEYIQIKLQSRLNNGDEVIEEIIHTWNIPFAPSKEDTPLLVFRLDGQQYRWNQTIPADYWVLLYPQSANIVIDGEGHKTEQFNELSGDWRGWQATAWDLTQASGIRLVDNEQTTWSIPIRGLEQPILVRESRLEVDSGPTETDLYIGTAPKLRIPVRSNHPLAQELANWKVSIHSKETARCLNLGHDLSALHEHVHDRNDRGYVDIDLGDYTGDDACGTFVIRIHGEQCGWLEFAFRLWNQLDVEGLPTYILPETDKTQPLQINIKLAEIAWLKPMSVTDDLHLEKVDGIYHLTIGPSVNRADLWLETTRTEDKGNVQVPLFLQIPRLRWTLNLGEVGESSSWVNRPLKVSVKRFRQTSNPGLYLELTGISDMRRNIRLSLIRLLDASGKIEKLMTVPGESISLRGDRLYFILNQFFATIDFYQQESLLEFVLEMPAADGKGISCITVMYLARELEISNVQLIPIDTTSYKLIWEEIHKLRHRNVLLWSHWKPWEDLKYYPIPDSPKGELILEDVGLPPSDYWVGFFIAYPWHKPPERDEIRENVHSVHTILPDDQLGILESLIQKNPGLEFQYHFERSCIYDSIGNQGERRKEINWCFQNLIKANIHLALDFHNWLGEKSDIEPTPRDQFTQKAVQMRMFNKEMVDKFYQAFPDNNDPMHRKYIGLFQQTKPQLESCKKILQHESDIPIIVHALKVLIQKTSEDWTLSDALSLVITQVKKGNLSVDYAKDLLSEKALEALNVLATLPGEPVVNELIVKLSTICPDQNIFVTTGFWVKTRYGWGEIEKIEGEKSEDLSFIRQDERNAILHIQLHPELEPMSAIVDLMQEELQVLSTNQLFICTHCNGFVTENRNLITNGEHKPKDQAHEGKGPASRPVPPIKTFDNEDIEYSNKCPYPIQEK